MSGSNFCNRAYLSHNLVIANIEGDGNCFYRSVSHQIYDNQHRHHELRELTYKNMQTKASEYIGSFFLNEKSFQQYLERIKTDGEWAKEVEIINLAEALDVYIFVHTDSGNLYTYPEVDMKVEKKTIHIWYDEGEHYCSIKSNNGTLDNFNPTQIPNYRGWKELNTQDRNKLNLIYHLAKLKSLEDIMDCLRKFDDSLVKTLDYLGNPNTVKGNGKGKNGGNGKDKGGRDKRKGGKKNKARI